MTGIPTRVHQRVWKRVTMGGVDDCWPSTWSRGSHGYPQIGWWADGRSRMTLVHRVVYEQAYGALVEETVDHICRNQVCANPRHLRELSNVENARRNRQAERGPGRRSYKDA